MAKGGAFEREIAKELSLWWTKGQRDDVFWRTIGSGAFGTIRRKGGKLVKNQHGDINAIDPIGDPLIDQVLISCKKGYASKAKKESQVFVHNWGVLDMIDSPSLVPTFWKFWLEAVEEGKEVNRIPLLVFQRHRMSKCIVYPQFLLRVLEHPFGFYPYNLLTVTSNLVCCVSGFADFLRWIKDPEQFLALLESFNAKPKRVILRTS